MNTTKYTFNKDNWSGQSATITVSELKGQNTGKTFGGTFKLYDYTFTVSFEDCEGKPGTDEQPLRWTTAVITSPSFPFPLGKACKFSDDESWEFHDGESFRECGIYRSDKNPYVAAAKLLSNII